MKCDFPGCKRKLTNRNYMFHLKFYHPKITNNIKHYICDYENCNKQYFTRNALLGHKYYHRVPTYSICHKCKQIINILDYSKHLNNHKKIKIFNISKIPKQN